MNSSRRRAAGLIGLVVAVLAAGRLLTMPEPSSTPSPAAVAETTVTDLWPSSTVMQSPGRLGDGRAYTPWFHLDPSTSVGTALTGDGSAMRLIVRAGTTERELLRLPARENPQSRPAVTSRKPPPCCTAPRERTAPPRC